MVSPEQSAAICIVFDRHHLDLIKTNTDQIEANFLKEFEDEGRLRLPIFSAVVNEVDNNFSSNNNNNSDGINDDDDDNSDGCSI